MLDPRKVLNTIEKAATSLRAVPGRRGGIVSLTPDSASDVVVVGDLHGHVDVFGEILKRVQLDAHPMRHLIVQELVHDTRVDPDEGQVDRSHRLVDLFCAVICKYPHRAHYLIGNHELSELTGRSISKGGFSLDAIFRAGIEADYPGHSEGFLAAYRLLFSALPLAVRLPNRVFVCHTVPDAHDLDHFDPGIYASTTWSDEQMKRGGTVYALTWGRATDEPTAARFLELVDADLAVCGHHPCEEGFLVPNRRMLILDGTEPAPAYALIPAAQPLSMDQLAANVKIVPLVS